MTLRPAEAEFAVSEGWNHVLEAAGLSTFGALWDLPREWVDEPNERRDGWSAVSRHELPCPDGGSPTVIFVKREQDYFNHLSLPFLPPPLVMRREIRNILEYRGRGIPSLELVAWGERQLGDARQGVVVTAELAGFMSLQDLFSKWAENGWPPVRARNRFLQAVARFVRRLHDRGMRHNMLYPKHIFVRRDLCDGGERAWTDVHEGDIRLIDLETSCRARVHTFALYKDLDRLNRSTRGWSDRDRLRFLKHYTGHAHLTFMDRCMLRILIARADRKKKHRRIRASRTAVQAPTPNP